MLLYRLSLYYPYPFLHAECLKIAGRVRRRTKVPYRWSNEKESQRETFCGVPVIVFVSWSYTYYAFSFTKIQKYWHVYLIMFVSRFSVSPTFFQDSFMPSTATFNWNQLNIQTKYFKSKWRIRGYSKKLRHSFRSWSIVIYRKLENLKIFNKVFYIEMNWI